MMAAHRRSGRQIADACFAMLHSSLTNEVDPIKPDDPRVPEVIRALHPIAIGMLPQRLFGVQIDGSGKPPEYFLMRLPGHTNTWVLCAAGSTDSIRSTRDFKDRA